MKISKEKEEVRAMEEYSKIDRVLKLNPKCKIEFLRLYRCLIDKDGFCVRGRSANVSSLIYIVTRENDSLVMLEDLSEIYNIKSKRIFKFLKKNIRTLNIHLKPDSIDIFLDIFSNELKIKPKQYEKAKELLKEFNLDGKSKKVLVLSVLTYISKLKPSYITKKYNVSPYTIRKYKKLIERKIKKR